MLVKITDMLIFFKYSFKVVSAIAIILGISIVISICFTVASYNRCISDITASYYMSDVEKTRLYFTTDYDYPETSMKQTTTINGKE